jgi:two-component system, NarL family, nitrate/nitrite response regulator NarL
MGLGDRAPDSPADFTEHRDTDVGAAVEDCPRDAGTAQPQPVRVLIVDDLPIFRDGLRLLLAADARLQIVADTAGESTAAALVRALHPDVLLLGSVSAEGGPIGMLKRLAAAHLCVRTILLVTSINTPEILDALQFGARGVVARDSAAESVFESIDAVSAGAYWIGHERATGDVPAMIRRLEHARNDASRFGLTRRELEVIRGVVTGETNHQLAARLSISENTVKRHLVNVFDKVGASTRVELALFAVYHRLLHDD